MTDTSPKKKIRMGILEESIDKHHYRMSLHPQFLEHHFKGATLYFEIVDSDGKKKRVICNVSPHTHLDEKSGLEENERFLNCDDVLDLVRNGSTALNSNPTSGAVIYLVKDNVSNPPFD